ncbi:MAG: protein kinase family protein, partial [Thermoplasmataceae archaeon]
ERIARKIVESVDWIQRAGIAHGDLSGDNIIIGENSRVYFVDYDGMFIPEFSGEEANEIGHAGFQHPLRVSKHFGPSLDNFSALVIYFSLLAIAKNPVLWERFNDDDPDCLILRRKDFQNLKGSIAFNEATRTRSRRLKTLGNLLIQAVQHDPMWDGSAPGNLLSI